MSLGHSQLSMFNLNNSPVKERLLTSPMTKSGKVKQHSSFKKQKITSLFNENEYASFNELMEKIDCPIATYIKNQKGSR
jgi:hypothetical protein